MIFFLYFSCCLCWAFRSIASLFYGSNRFKYSLLFLVYLSVAFPLALPVASSIKQDLFIKISAAAFLIALTGYSLYRQKGRRVEKFSLRKTIVWICFLAIGPLLIGINAIENLSAEKPVLKVCLTGKTEMREMVWKNPTGRLKLSSIECHEIVFQSIDGKEIARFLLSGDLIGVRAKILRFHPFLNAIGISNKFQPDIVYTGYRRAEDYGEFPVEAHSLAFPTSFFHSFLLRCWETLFFHHSNSLWFKSGNLESNYFPVVDKSGQVLEGEYFLTLSSAGLSAIKI